MSDDRPTNSSVEVSRAQPSLTREDGWRAFLQGPKPEEISRLLNLREVEREFGLTAHKVYEAVRRGQLHAVQVGGKGRIYYPEWEVRGLTKCYPALVAA